MSMGGIFGKWWSKRRRGSRRRDASGKDTDANQVAADLHGVRHDQHSDNKDARREGVDRVQRATMTLSIGAGDAPTDDGASVDTTCSRRRSRVKCLGWGGSWGGSLSGLMKGRRAKSSRNLYSDSPSPEIPREAGGGAGFDGGSGWRRWNSLGHRMSRKPPVHDEYPTNIDEARYVDNAWSETARDEKSPLTRRKSAVDDRKARDLIAAEKRRVGKPATYTSDLHESSLVKDHTVDAHAPSGKKTDTPIYGDDNEDIEDEDVRELWRLKKLCLAQFVQMELLWEYVSQLRRQCKALRKTIRKLEGRQIDLTLLRKRAEALEEENELMRKMLMQGRSEESNAERSPPEEQVGSTT